MRFFVWFMSMLVILCAPAAVAQNRFKVGDRVEVKTTRETGTIVEVSANGTQVKVKKDSSTDHPAVYFALSPDLQPSSSAAPADANGGKFPGTAGAAGNFPAANGGANFDPPGAKRDSWTKSPPVGGPLTEAIVKRLIEDGLEVNLNHNNEKLVMEWRGVQIAAPKPVDFAQGLDVKLTEGTKVYPVRADFKYTVQNLRYANDKHVVDRIGYAYFYKDEFEHWAYTWYAHTGQQNR